MDFFEDILSFIADLFIPPLNYVIGIMVLVFGIILIMNPETSSIIIVGLMLTIAGVTIIAMKIRKDFRKTRKK